MMNASFTLAGSPTHVVLIPIKSFERAKERLAPDLTGAQRRQLVETMAATVIRASAPLDVVVVCDDPAVASWARQHGAIALFEPAADLNAAVTLGVDRLREAGVERVTVAHGDLPLAAGISDLSDEGIVLVPDRRHDGTNVIALPSNVNFSFQYGAGSFTRHVSEARRLGFDPQICDIACLSFDVDEPDDLSVLDSVPTP